MLCVTQAHGKASPANPNMQACSRGVAGGGGIGGTRVPVTPLLLAGFKQTTYNR